ncbi:MAG: hypothetical protein ABJE95_04035 [Byssovorax sp.]
MTTDAPKDIVFDLPSGKLTVHEADLEAIRAAVIAYLRGSTEEQRDTLAKELAGAMVWIDEDGTGRINQWLLERRGDHLALVRHPARSPVMTLFVADLARDDHAIWKVTALRQERVQGR